MSDDVESDTPAEAPAVKWAEAPWVAPAAPPTLPTPPTPWAPPAAQPDPWPAPTAPQPPWAAPTQPPWAAPTQDPWAAAGSPQPPQAPQAPQAPWAPPGQPAGGGGWPPAPGPWGAPPVDPWGRPTTPVSPRRRSVAPAAAVVAALVAAALFGVGVGRAINRGRTITTSVAGTPNQPATGFGPGSGGSGGSGSQGSTGGLSRSAVTAIDNGVVDIDTRLSYQSATAAGTGMILTSNGEVLTNNHVIDQATSITATVVATGRTYTAKVIGTDPTSDVAVLQLQGASGLSTIPLGDSSSVSPGDNVVAIGNAGGVGGTPSVVSGTVQATGQTITASDQGGANAERLSNLIETDAPIQPGDSGGPLVNANGTVVGMDTAASQGGRFQLTSGAAYAIPINDALSVAKLIESGQASATVHLGLPGFIGVGVDPNSTNGAGITAVVSGGPASKIGIRTGDVITSVNGQKITLPTDLTTVLHAHHAGDRVTVTWTDQSGASHTATATLIAGPAD